MHINVVSRRPTTMIAAHLLAVLLLVNVFQETARCPVSIDLLYTSQCQFYDELPEWGATWIKDNVYEISAAGGAGLRAARQAFRGKLAASETGLVVVSTVCHGLDAPQQMYETVPIMVSATRGGTAAPQEGTETALPMVSNMCGRLSAPLETALEVVNCCGICPAISPSEEKALAVWSNRLSRNEIILSMIFVTLTVISIHIVLTYRAIQNFLQNQEEEFLEPDIIVIIIEPMRFDNRRHG